MPGKIRFFTLQIDSRRRHRVLGNIFLLMFWTLSRTVSTGRLFLWTLLQEEDNLNYHQRMVHEKLDVKDLMSERLACLPPVVSLMDLSSILRGDCHGAFPITSDAVIGGPTESPIKLEGVVTRTQILRAVKYRVGFIKMVGYNSAPTNILPSPFFAALSVYIYHGDTRYIIYTCGVGYSVCSCIQGAVMCFFDRCGSVATRKIVENLSRKCDCILPFICVIHKQCTSASGLRPSRNGHQYCLDLNTEKYCWKIGFQI